MLCMFGGDGICDSARFHLDNCSCTGRNDDDPDDDDDDDDDE